MTPDFRCSPPSLGATRTSCAKPIAIGTFVHAASWQTRPSLPQSAPRFRIAKAPRRLNGESLSTLRKFAAGVGCFAKSLF
jgi:hypothetical protein